MNFTNGVFYRMSDAHDYGHDVNYLWWLDEPVPDFSNNEPEPKTLPSSSSIGTTKSCSENEFDNLDWMSELGLSPSTESDFDDIEPEPEALPSSSSITNHDSQHQIMDISM